MKTWSTLLKQITKKTDQTALKYFGARNLNVQIKPDQTPVSQADLEIEEYIREFVQKSHPELSILGEEFGDSNPDSNLKLIIDPIDGTRNFVRGIPHFATLLAIEENNEIIAGLVSAPATNDQWYAEKNKGAYHNDKKINVSSINSIEKAQAFHGSLFGSEAPLDTTPIIELLKKTDRQRGFGDYYQHMLVAMGTGEFAIDFPLKPWDTAPLKIIIEEAGGKFTDFQGTPSIYTGTVITSNNLFHNELIKMLTGMS